MLHIFDSNRFSLDKKTILNIIRKLLQYQHRRTDLFCFFFFFFFARWGTWITTRKAWLAFINLRLINISINFIYIFESQFRKISILRPGIKFAFEHVAITWRKVNKSYIRSGIRNSIFSEWRRYEIVTNLSFETHGTRCRQTKKKILSSENCLMFSSLLFFFFIFSAPNNLTVDCFHIHGTNHNLSIGH